MADKYDRNKKNSNKTKRKSQWDKETTKDLVDIVLKGKKLKKTRKNRNY